MKVRYVVGAPVWQRSWSLPLWFESVKANIDPKQTGLVFVVPSTDQYSRDVINQHKDEFAWLVVERDKGEQFDRQKRGEENNHATLAAARNQILAHVNQAKPDWYLSWDSDLLIPPGTVEAIEQTENPISTVWTWLNRQKPQTMRHVNPQTRKSRMVRWQEPMAATAMTWDKPLIPAHLPAHEWHMRAKGWWRADVVLAFQMMRHQVYSTTMYKPHKYGEDIPFNWDLQRRSIPRFCYGERQGIHLYKKDEEEIALGWPGICQLEVEAPLAATILDPREPLDEALGFYEMEEGTNGRSPGDVQRNGSGRRDAGSKQGRTKRRYLSDASRSDHPGRSNEESSAAA